MQYYKVIKTTCGNIYRESQWLCNTFETALRLSIEVLNSETPSKFPFFDFTCNPSLDEDKIFQNKNEVIFSHTITIKKVLRSKIDVNAYYSKRRGCTKNKSIVVLTLGDVKSEDFSFLHSRYKKVIV
jgi:hypothetical protein